MSPASSSSSRWCPTPEQIMILEEMYRGGIRTPNASQIQQITAHLSRYGKIEGKNVFYWFQNHKARDRQKLRRKLLKQLQQQHHHPHNTKLLYHQLPTYPHLQYPHPHPHAHPPLTYNSSSTNNLREQLSHHHCDLPSEFLPQGGVEKASTPLMNHTGKADFLKMLKTEKSTSRRYRRDWTMMMDVGPTTPSRPLETLELFPITATGSLKDDCTTSNHFSCSN